MSTESSFDALDDSPDLQQAPLPNSGPTNSTRLGSDGQTYTIGFIGIESDPKTSNTIGGFLITDNTGVPVEFLLTKTVRPTPAQRILYGKRLQSYLSVDLCARQLVDDVKTRPGVIFVESELMLALHRFTDIPVLWLQTPTELGQTSSRPSVTPPPQRPEYAEVIDLMSLDSDMIDAFRRIEQCRTTLANENPDFVI